MKTTAQTVLDAYRADAQEREGYLRSLEQRNRILEAQDALRSRQLLFARDCEESLFFLGAFAGACVFGTISAIGAERPDAAVIYGSLTLLFVGIRVALRLALRGRRP